MSTPPTRPANASGRSDRGNNACSLRREILIRIARAFFKNELRDSVDRIPFDMRPKHSAAPFRCCIYKERAILRLRTIAGLGGRIEDDDDVTPLAEYAARADARTAPEEPVLTVVDIACKGCVESRFYVTELCQGCLARPCQANCNFGAITINGGRATIDPTKCKKCGRCMTVCPYQAISRIHVPCEEACPVGAIHKSEEGRAIIDFDQCTSCGRCMRACPFGAIMERSQIVDVLRALQGKKPVVALVAPAIVGQFPCSPEQIAAALKKLGFAETLPVAVGADLTAIHEGCEFLEKMKNGQAFMTSSCCPAYIETVRKHLPELKPFVSGTPTPMHFSAEWAKKKNPDCVVVFIGPCVAKRTEGTRDPAVDYVLTFEELGSLFVAADIELIEMPPEETANASAQGKGFAITGGVAAAVSTMVDRLQTAEEQPNNETSKNGDRQPESDRKIEVVPICVDGLSPSGIKQLRSFAQGKCPGNLVEIMTCPGGCVGGAGTLGNPAIASREIKKLVDSTPSLPERLQSEEFQSIIHIVEE